MKRDLNIYGFEVEVEYNIVDDLVYVHKVHIKDGTNAIAIQQLDIIAEATEILEAELLEQEDQLFADKNIDKEKPF